MVDVKRFVKDIFLLGTGAAAGYTVNELKQRDKRRKVRLGVIGSMGAVYALYMTMNHFGPQYLDYRTKMDTLREKHQYTIDSMRIEKGYDNPDPKLNEFDRQMREHDRKMNDLLPNLENKLEQDIDKKIDKQLTQKINPLYNDQKKILEEVSRQKLENKHNSKSLLDSIVDFFTPDDGANSKISTIKNYSGFIMDIDKSSNTLSLFNSNQKLLYSCPISLSKFGGPPTGQYKVNTIAARGGNLYPGVIKLTDIIVITGAGEYNQYADAIRNRQNITKTGGRIETKDYNTIVSTVKNKEVTVHIYD
jgi:hypothetical protein